MVLTNNTAWCYNVNKQWSKFAFFGMLTSVGALFGSPKNIYILGEKEMKKMKLVLLVCLALLTCALMFTSCDSVSEVQTPNDTTAPETEVHIHAFDKWITVKEATCTVEGTQERTCFCGATETKSVVATGHSLKETEIVKRTCQTEKAFKRISCEYCDQIFEEAIPDIRLELKLTKRDIIWVQPISFSYSFHAYAAGGYDDYLYRFELYDTDSPSKALIEQDFSDKSMFDFESTNGIESIVVKAIVKDSAGNQASMEILADPFTVLNTSVSGAHVLTSTIVPPTTYEQGYTEYICNVCNHTYRDTYVPALGSQGLSYIVNTDKKTCTITGIGTCIDRDIVIPSMIDGFIVIAIEDNAFNNLTSVKSISISDTVKRIGNRAFYKCSAIKELTIPASVTSIGKQIFLGCDSLSTVYYNSAFSPVEGETFLNYNSIKKVVFGDNLTRIPDYICYNCNNLTQIILSSNTKVIGSYAFYYTSIKKIDLPDGLQDTGWYSFYGTPLTEITLPDTVTRIYNSFRDCNQLKTIVFPINLISVPSQTFYLCSSLSEVYYKGNELDWSGVSISESSEELTFATVYFYSEKRPSEQGNFWHYINDVPTVW